MSVKKKPTVRGLLVSEALPIRTAGAVLPAANLQYGTDSGAAAVVHSIAAYHSGAYIVEVCAGLRQVNLGSLCSGGGTAAAAAVDIVHGGSIADTGDISPGNQGCVDRVDGDSRAADLADTAGGNGYMKLCISAVIAAVVITAVVTAVVAAIAASIVAAAGAGASRTASASAGTRAAIAAIAAGGAASTGAASAGGAAGPAAGTGTGGARTATGVGAVVITAAGRTSIASTPGTGAGIVTTFHIQSKPPIQWFAPSYSAGRKSVRRFSAWKKLPERQHSGILPFLHRGLPVRPDLSENFFKKSEFYF